MGLGVLIGRRIQHLSDSLSEPFGVLQGALLGVVGLILAFGLSLAVTRYDDRRSAVVDEANAIGTTWLRAQTLEEPQRSRSLTLLQNYTETAVDFADHQPGSDAEREATAAEEEIQRRLWRQAGEALNDAPEASAPRLYVETLNEMIDAQGTRLAGVNNRVPTAVFLLELFGAALALGLLGAYLTLIGRGVPALILAGALVAWLLVVINDLDRPTRGMIRVPDTALVNQLETQERAPTAPAPASANPSP